MYKLLSEQDRERIKILYQTKGLLYEQSVFGQIARKALSWVGKNEDDIMKLFKTTEVALAKNIDDIISSSLKSKNISGLKDLELKLMHIFNPSGSSKNVQQAQANTKKILNGYAKSKGKGSWGEIRNEVLGNKPPITKMQPGTRSGTSWFSGKRIGKKTLDSLTRPDSPYKINWNNITNKGNGKTEQEFVDHYNKLIAKSIETGDYSYISRKGFESLGIDNFREFLENNIERVNRVVPETGDWSVNFK